MRLAALLILATPLAACATGTDPGGEATGAATATAASGPAGVGGSNATSASSSGGSTGATTSGSGAGGAAGSWRLGVFRPSDATWTLDDGNGSLDGCGVDTCLPAFGQSGDVPVAGDWTGAGNSSVGVFRPSDLTWWLDDGNGGWDGCAVDTCLPPFGAPGDLAVVGDWNGTGKTAIGVFRPSDGTWTLDDGSGSFDGCGVDTCLPPFGAPGDLPVAGDWTGAGKSAIGVFRPSDATWTLDDGDGVWEGCGVETCLPPFGAMGDVPVAGDWAGTGRSAIGVFRPSDLTWTLDDGNGAWDGCGVESCLVFGAAGDAPVVGPW